MLVKPVGTQDLLRQIEALLVRHEDQKRLRERQPLAMEQPVSRPAGPARRKVS
jgi:hypothetical protein